MNDLGQSLSASLDRYGRGGMLAPFQFTDGTESAPGATWSNEPTTGLYRAAYGDLRFTLTGTDVQRWTSANAYLWRNSQWEEILTQAGGSGDTTINNLVVTGSFTSPGIDDNATSTAITIDANENVGIGTSNPAYRLDVDSDTDVMGRFTSSGGATAFIGGDANVAYLGGSEGGANSINIYEDLNLLRFYTDTEERMRINATGDVGIGTANPNIMGWGNALTVDSSTQPAVELAQAGVATGYFASQSDGRLRLGNQVSGQPIQFLTADAGVAAVINGSGYVGIGTDSPEKELEVHGDGTTQVRIVGGDTGGAILNFGTTSIPADARIVYSNVSKLMQFRTNNGAYAFNIDGTGNVGIGTSAPTNALDIEVEGGGVQLKMGRTVSNVGSTWMGSDASGFHLGVGAYGAGNSVADPNGFTVDTSGNVGIGTNSTSYKTEIATNSTTYLGITSGDSSVSGVLLGKASNKSLSRLVHDNNDNSLQLWTNASEAMRITSSGKVGIGVNNPTRVLQTDGTQVDFSRNGRTIELNPNTGNANTHSTILVDSGMGLSVDIQGFGEAMRVSNGGNLLVGATSPAQVTSGSVNGCYLSGSADTSFSRSTTNNRGQIAFYNPNGLVGQITTSGNTTNYAEQSDERLKENVVDAPAGNIDSIKVRSFDWKSDGEHQEYGFIAQELETVAPYAVSKGETDEDMWAVDYSKLVPMLVKEIQDLKAEVAALKGA
jgi:hypothetical protein